MQQCRMHPLAVRSCSIHLSMHPGSLNTFFPNLRQPPEERRKEEASEVKLRHDVSRQLQSVDLAMGGSGTRFTRQTFGLRFGLGIGLRFGLRFSILEKEFRHVTKSKINLKPILKPNLKPKTCLGNQAPDLGRESR